MVFEQPELAEQRDFGRLREILYEDVFVERFPFFCYQLWFNSYEMSLGMDNRQQTTEKNMNWYVVYTKLKWEKKVAERLNEIGVVTYCPVIAKISQWSDRKKTINMPLFNSYIFVQIEEKNRNRIFEVAGAIRYLFWLGKPAIVRNSEIEAIQKWLSAPDEYEIVLDTLKKGDKIVLESGPFVSQPAIIQEVKQNHYILILESLGCLLRVDKKEV